MKVFLINVYQTDGKNWWADTQVFTSEKQRDACYQDLPRGTDADKQEVTINKRIYKKREAPEAQLTPPKLIEAQS